MNNATFAKPDAPSIHPNTNTMRPGTQVFLNGDIKAMVTASMMREAPDGSLYVSRLEVVWWEGRNRHEDWVGTREVTPIEDTKPVGFRSE